VMGVPLVHIATGVDPATGRNRIARGVIAMGDVAIGFVALGGAAFGGLTVGGLSVGLVSLGGCAIGLWLAMGGFALGLFSMGGLAIGGIAAGGCAIGYHAYGGAGFGAYVYAGNRQDELEAFVLKPSDEGWLNLLGLLVPLSFMAVSLAVWLAHRKAEATNESSGKENGEESVLRRAMSDPWSRAVLKSASLVVYLASLVMFFSFNGTASSDSNGLAGKFTAGQPTPWLEVQYGPTGHSRHIHFVSAASLVAVVGLLSLAFYRQLETIENGSAHSMLWHYGLWAVLFAVVMYLSTADFQRKIAAKPVVPTPSLISLD
jgi:MFS family permease